MTDMTVSKIILDQLGGRRFCVMTGAKNLIGGENTLSFQIGSGAKNKATRVRVTLTPDDLYTVEFARVRKLDYIVISKHEGIYNDMLPELFTNETGMYTRM